MKHNDYLDTSIVFLTGALIYRKFGGVVLANSITVTMLAFIICIFALLEHKKYLGGNRVSVRYDKSVTFLLMLFLLNMLASLLWTNALMYGAAKVATEFGTLVLFTLVAPILRRNTVLFLIANIVYVTIYTYSLYIEFGDIEDLFSSLHNQYRLGWDKVEESNFTPIDISRYITFALINIIYLYILFKGRAGWLYKVAFSVCVILLVPILLMYLFFSGTKTPILALIIAFMLLFIFNGKIATIKSKIAFMVLALFIGVGSVSVYYSNIKLLSDEQEDYIEYRFFDKDSALSDRAYQNQRALDHVNHYNFLLGSGSGNFGYLFSKQDTRDYPHNVLSEVLYENGIVNLWIIIYLFYRVITKSRGAIPVDSYYIACFYYFFINSLFSGDLLSNSIFLGFLVMVFTSDKSAPNKGSMPFRVETDERRVV